MRQKGRLAIIAICGITFTAFCIEYLSYIHNSSTWPKLSKGKDVVARALFVADPQIQGEKDESWMFGWITRWDADKYLQKNYRLAKSHVEPDIIVFLGDLFDEGSKASDPEYRRYFKRFSSIFDLPTNQNPSTIKYIFVPGDNDVGGEKSEPVDQVKINWFAKTFGNLKDVVSHSGKDVTVQFVKMNLFLPSEYNDPLKGFENVINESKKPDIRFIVSHISLLSFMTSAVQQVLEKLQPSLVFAAHSHRSAYLKLTEGKRTVDIIHDFLSPTSKSQSHSGKQSSIDIPRASLSLDVKTHVKGEIREILVPTCSYRMGVPDMGYGAMQLYKNGTMEYTVLWLPSRFKQLFLYGFIYILAKIIITPWAFWKLATFACKKWYEYNSARKLAFINQNNGYQKVV